MNGNIIITGLVKLREGGFANLLAKRKTFKEAEILRVKLLRKKEVKSVKIQTLKQWEKDGMPGQLALFTQ